MLTAATIYRTLLEAYGPQGWWPLLEIQASDPTDSGQLTGYHPGRYDFPRNRRQRFEICLGAILTQNTAWRNVEKALFALHREQLLAPEKILATPLEKLALLIRPSGYFNVKALKLQQFCRFYLSTDNAHPPSRDELLAVWGIGPETADSILLYAYNQPAMVVDTYTRRILLHLKLIEEQSSYPRIQSFCQNSLPVDPAVYQEFHALMVEHGKRGEGGIAIRPG